MCVCVCVCVYIYIYIYIYIYVYVEVAIEEGGESICVRVASLISSPCFLVVLCFSFFR